MINRYSANTIMISVITSLLLILYSAKNFADENKTTIGYVCNNCDELNPPSVESHTLSKDGLKIHTTSIPPYATLYLTANDNPIKVKVPKADNSTAIPIYDNATGLQVGDLQGGKTVTLSSGDYNFALVDSPMEIKIDK